MDFYAQVFALVEGLKILFILILKTAFSFERFFELKYISISVIFVIQVVQTVIAELNEHSKIKIVRENLRFG